MEHITKRFPGVIANDDVSLELRAGEVHALIGENGAGKSTLMRVLYGMYPADEGRIVVNGEEVKIASPRVAIEHGIGMVHQHFVLVDPFTVTENVILGDEGQAILDMDAAHEKVATLAEDVRLPGAPERGDRGPLRRRGAARRDPEGALSGRRPADPRRADGGAHPARGEGPVREPPAPAGRREGDRLHQPQARRGLGHRRSHHGAAARTDRRRDAARPRPPRRSSPR